MPAGKAPNNRPVLVREVVFDLLVSKGLVENSSFPMFDLVLISHLCVDLCLFGKEESAAAALSSFPNKHVHKEEIKYRSMYRSVILTVHT